MKTTDLHFAAQTLKIKANPKEKINLFNQGVNVTFNSRTTFMFLFTIFFFFTFNTVHADFSGKWCSDKDNDVNAFALIIHKSKDQYHGGYYSVAQRGDKIDDNDMAFSFNSRKKKTVITKLHAGISGNIGLIQLKLLNDKKINWLVLKAPKGEIFVPNEATLYKCK